jgi:hypothetical protein
VANEVIDDRGGGGPGTPAPPKPLPNQTEILATTIANLVERQLAAQATKVDALLEELRQQSAVDREGLRSVLDARITDLQQSNQHRQDELEARIDRVAHESGADYVDEQVGALAARLEESSRALRRFDDQAAALVHHVNETTEALAKRMDEGDQTIVHAVEGRLAQVREVFEALSGDVQRQILDVGVQMNSKLEGSDARITDRMLALEERVKEDFGTKVAHLDATIGRIGGGFDDAMAAVSQRVAELEARLIGTDERLTALAEKLGKVDEEAMQEVKEQLSTAIGEAMLVRIELDRHAAVNDERFDNANVRLSEVEAHMNDQMDVSAAVQLERLDELERAIVQLDPTQFVRKADLADGVHATPSASPSQPVPLAAPTPDPTLPNGSSSTNEPSLSSH